MIVWMFRLLFLSALAILVYSAWKYAKDPKRKWEAARRKKQFSMLDDPKDARKNMFITYKGVDFEGEKYVGNSENAFVVSSIIMRIVDAGSLFGLQREDFYAIEKEIYAIYPHADIEWQSPVDDFLKHR
ncbi:MAG TPA: sigma-w pathway protein ysdB [Bacillales bacterium]|nr:sigma-w pathway protein ysdB [Bacillales bacterium]